MLVPLVLGLLVLKAVEASPRFSRQVDLDTYDNAHYDVDLENLNLENQDIYDYEDGLTIDDPQVRNWKTVWPKTLLVLAFSVPTVRTKENLYVYIVQLHRLVAFNWQLK